MGLSFSGAFVALLAGAGFLLFLVGLACLASSVLHLLLRDRRRGDIVMPVLVRAIPIVALAPQVLFPGQGIAARERERRGAGAERRRREPW